jgi:hypothetical protein
MYMQIRFTLLFLMICGIVQAQNTSSPYSIYGLGDFQTSAYNRTTGMASTGIAYRNENSIIQNNPAAYTALIPQFFHVEAGGRGQFSSYTNASYSNINNQGAAQISNDFMVTRFAFATKVTRWWGASIGLMPYTQMNYSFTALEAQNGGALDEVSYTGTGGLHKAYWGNGFSLGKHLSVGVNTSFIFGALNEDEVLTDAASNSDIETTRNLYLRNANFDFGAQYYTQFGRNKAWALGLGATYTYKQRLDAQDSLSVIDNGTAVAVGGNNNTYGLLDQNLYYLPSGFGGGLSLSKDSRMKKITFLADYQQQNWNSLGEYGVGYTLNNSQKYSAGLEVSKRANIFNTPVEHIYYQFGAYYDKTYVSLNGDPVREVGGSVGFGVNPLKYPRWGYNLALEAGSRFSSEQNAIREDFVRLTITIHYWDIWLTKGRRVQ